MTGPRAIHPLTLSGAPAERRGGVEGRPSFALGAAVALGTLGVLAALAAPAARAENGARLFGQGAVSRGMGGVGVAAPQEAIGALTSNPAAVIFRPHAERPEVGFGGTLAIPSARAKVTVDGTEFRGRDRRILPVSTVGLAIPLGEPAEKGVPPRWVLGLATFAVGGLGIDYRDTRLDQPAFYDLGGGATAPLIAGEFAALQAGTFSPSISWRALDRLALGAQLSAGASGLDLRRGSSIGYSAGGQFGVSFRPHDAVLLGLSYTLPQRTRFKRVLDRDGDGRLDSLTSEFPHQLALGLAVEPIAEALLLEVDLKWADYSSAKGFDDQDWKDQWIVATGVQARPLDWIALRLGYNFGSNPIRSHDGFIGTETVAGVPRWYAETARMIGNAAFLEHHVTAGLTLEMDERLTNHLGFVYTPSKTIRADGTDLLGRPASIRHRIDRIHTIEIGLTLRF